MRHPALVLAVSLALAPASRADAQQPAALTAFLRDNVKLTPEQLATVERGEVVVKVLPSTNDRDIAVFGVIAANAPRASYIASVKDFRASLASPTRPQFGVFGNPPAAADLQALTVSKDEASDLASCKPGDCAMKLTAGDMQTLRSQMHWNSPNLAAEVSAHARKRFLEYVIDYRARGDAAMAVFADRNNVSASTAFAEMLGDSPYVFQKTPSVGKYLTGYPATKLADATEVFFWSQDDLPRLRPIISITHEIVLNPPELSATTVIAAKQIYANHYFEAGADITLVTDRGTNGIYLVTLRRYRFDKLPGGILNIKGKATEALRDLLGEDLKRSKARAEKR